MTFTTGDVYRIAARLVKDGQDDIINVFHLLCLNDNSATQDDLRDDIRRWITSMYQANAGQMAAGIVAQSMTVFNVSQQVLEGIFSFDASVSGGGGGDALPNVDAPYMFARTLLKRVRGGKFWPALSEAHQANSIIGSTAITALTSALVTWISPFTGSVAAASWVPGIVQTIGGQPPPFVAFTNGVLRTLLGVQSRRKIGRGA